MDTSVGERLRAWREHAGLSQASVAAVLGVDRSAVAQWESGNNDPPTRRLLCLADMLGITMSQFWGALPELTEGRRRRKRSC